MAKDFESKSTKGKNCISVNEMAKVLGCTISNVTSLLRRGTIVGCKTQTGWNVKRNDFLKYLGYYVSIVQAEANIESKQKELKIKERELAESFRGVSEMSYAFDAIIEHIGRMFNIFDSEHSEENKSFKFSDVIRLGITNMVVDKSAKWNLSKDITRSIIGRKVSRFANSLSDCENYYKLKSEKEILEKKLDLTEKNLKVTLSRLEKYDAAYNEKITKNETPIMLKKIIDCGFTVRLTNCLCAAGVEYVGELLNYTRNDILKFRNLGKNSLQELEEFLKENDIKW